MRDAGLTTHTRHTIEPHCVIPAKIRGFLNSAPLRWRLCRRRRRPGSTVTRVMAGSRCIRTRTAAANIQGIAIEAPLTPSSHYMIAKAFVLVIQVLVVMSLWPTGISLVILTAAATVHVATARGQLISQLTLTPCINAEYERAGRRRLPATRPTRARPPILYLKWVPPHALRSAN